MNFARLAELNVDMCLISLRSARANFIELQNGKVQSKSKSKEMQRNSTAKYSIGYLNEKFEIGVYIKKHIFLLLDMKIKVKTEVI
jgi:hypothetical protein